MALTPFHLSFEVPDLEAARRFYLDVLDCRPGRDAGTWVDVLLFGHQLTIRQSSSREHARALDHFGVVLDKSDWQALAQRLDARGIAYVVPPRVLSAGGGDESGKFLLHDPASNLLEFKYYVDFAQAMGGDR